MASHLEELKKGLKSMENTKKEKKAEEKAMTVSPSDGPDYPWGLQIELNNGSLKKLGLKSKDFDIGTEVCIVAKAKVCSISSNKGSGYDSENISLQICEMAVKEEDE